MLAYGLQRLAQAILVMLVVGLISFSLFQFVGDPINNMVGPEATIEQRQALRERLGYLVLIALFFVLINPVVDLLYYVVDPRLRVERPVAAQ